MTLLSYTPPQNPFLEVLYQQAGVVAINKPSGLLSVPGKAPEHKDSTWWRVTRVWPDARIVHRLDMATSGIILLALDKPTQAALNKQFEQRLVHKEYRARVWGQLPATRGLIDLPMRCDWPNRPKQCVDFEHGKAAQTGYQVLPRSPQADRTEVTDVALFPVSGRSHQLRVHMQALNTPILGDKFYAHPDAFNAAPRLLLHAHKITFTHPQLQTQVTLTSPVPF